VRLAWDANTEPDLAGYTVYAGTASGTYDLTANETEHTQFTATNADCGTTYFFVVTASDTSGNESGYSDEVSAVAK
jgi:fibronectin type 3 domain-containing protein